jgi:hypothetical protein
MSTDKKNIIAPTNPSATAKSFTKPKKDMVSVRKFCRMIERNMNNFQSIDSYQDASRQCRGFFLKLDSVNGIKKSWKNNAIPNDKNYYLRFFLTFFNQKTSQFYGNTFKSPMLKIKFNETGHYELIDKDPLYVYFLTNTNTNQNGNTASSSSMSKLIHQCVVEVVFVETNKSDYILNQTCEGWGVIDVSEDSGMDQKQGSTPVYLGTCRSLLNKNLNQGNKNMHQIGGASIIYSCSIFKELEKIKFLLPNYVIVGPKDQLPGLLLTYLPKKPILNEPLKLFDFSDIYLKNVEIEVSPHLENRLIQYASMYRKQKYEIGEDLNNLNPVIVKERKLRCGIHNSWTFINSNGLENFVSLSKKENFLFYKGVQHIDNFFNSENCGLILELSYTLSLPGPKNQREELLVCIIGYSIIVLGGVDMDNNFRVANLITGPGVTVYGESLYDPIDSDDKVIKVNYIVSKNKDNYDKTYREKEIEEIKGQMESLKKSMIEEYNRMLTTKDKEKELLIKKKEAELEAMEAKLIESQRGLKTIYGKDDTTNFVPTKTYSDGIIPNSDRRGSFSQSNQGLQGPQVPQGPQGRTTQTLPQVNNKSKFIVDEQFNNADEAADLKMIEEMNKLQNRNTKIFDEKDISVIEDQNYEGGNRFQTSQKQFNPNIQNIQNNQQTKLKSGNSMIEIKDDALAGNFFRRVNEDQGLDDQYFGNERNEKFESRNNFDQFIQTKKNNFNNRYGYEPSSSNYDRDEYIFYKMFYQKHRESFDQEKVKESNVPKIVYDHSSKDISRRDKADLIAKGLLNLEASEKSENLLNFTLERELKDDKKAHSFVFHFLAYKPLSDIKDYNSIPDKIFFRFNFWDFEFFSTNVAIVSKPSSNITPSSTPLILQRENSILNAKNDEKEMKVQIDFDPSTDPNMDYKEFINYLLNKQLFIEIYEAEKLFFIGFVKVPLKDLLRQGKASIYQTKEFEIFDDKFNSKGYLQLLLKSTGISTHKSFVYDPSSLKVINTKDRFQSIPKKKKVMSKPLNVDKMIKQEQEVIAKNLMNSDMKDKKLGVDMNSLELSNNKTLKLNVDSEMQKRLRAMKYASGGSSNLSQMMFSDNKLSEMKVKQEMENQFYKTLNYANRLKEMKKKDILTKTIQDNNKNNLSVSLILGQPFFTNFVIHNNTEQDELLQLIVTRTSEENQEMKHKQQNDKIKESNDSVSIINSPEEWKYLTENYGLIRPNDYQSISPQNYLVIKPNESIPVLVKLLSYDEKVSNASYNIWVYKKSGQPLYFLNVTIIKVFPIIDHLFRYFMPENRYGTVKIPNPFKYDKSKTQKVLDNYISTDTMINLQLDPATNDFYFKGKMQSEGYKNEFFVFLYLDNHRGSLYSTWKFEINSLA